MKYCLVCGLELLKKNEINNYCHDKCYKIFNSSKPIKLLSKMDIKADDVVDIFNGLKNVRKLNDNLSTKYEKISNF